MKFFIIFLMFSQILLAQDPSPSSEEMFIQANKFYQNSNFEAAASLYEKLIANGFENGHLYYNLGNCYYRLNKIGPTILNYKKAQNLIPRNEDLALNLQLARNKVSDKIDWAENPVLKKLLFWHHKLNYKETVIAAIIINFIFWTVLIILIFLRREFLFYVFLSFLILLIAFCSSFTAKTFFKNNFGVVLEEEASVYSGNSETNTVIFKLHEGAEIKIIEKETDWLKIEIPQNQKGWIEEKFIGHVND